MRDLLDASVKLRDGKKLTDMHFNIVEKFALHKLMEKIKDTDCEKILKEHGVI